MLLDKDQWHRNGFLQFCKLGSVRYIKPFVCGSLKLKRDTLYSSTENESMGEKDTVLKMKQYDVLYSTEKGWGRAGHQASLLRVRSATFYKWNWEPKWTVRAKLKLTVHMLWRVQNEDQIQLKCWQVFLIFYYEQSRDEGKHLHLNKFIKKKKTTAFQNDQRCTRNHFTSYSGTRKSTRSTCGPGQSY